MSDTKAINILYVDDEESNLSIFKNAFRREFTIHLSTSASEGLAILKEHQIDMIITDQMMPEMTGIDFLKKVKEIYPDIPPSRLILSGYTPPEEIEMAYDQLNLFQFVSKPWKKEELMEIILSANQHCN